MISKNHPYLSKENVLQIYIRLKGSSKEIKKFEEEAIQVAKKGRTYWEFRDEEALFEVFRKHLEKELEVRKIDNFGRLMQYIS